MRKIRQFLKDLRFWYNYHRILRKHSWQARHEPNNRAKTRRIQKAVEKEMQTLGN